LNSTKPILAIAFEGVICDTYSGGNLLNESPVPGAMDALMELGRKYRLMIVTTNQPYKFSEISDWLTRNKGSRYFTCEITNQRPAATYYIEKRAIKFDSWNQTLNVLG
jgi:hypothetical protein